MMRAVLRLTSHTTQISRSIISASGSSIGTSLTLTAGSTRRGSWIRGKPPDMTSDYHGYPEGIPAPVGEGGIDLLRKLRGEERVTFNDVADHLGDYVRQNPKHVHAIEDVARFMAGVEHVEHDHDAVEN